MKNTTETPTPKLEELKSVRERQKLSIEAVAEQMKVSKDFVRYIEQGAFEKLGAPTFLRGHMTNYSKVLGLSPDTVLQQLPSHLLQHQNLQSSNAMGASPLARVKRQSNHLGRYAVGTTLLGMLGLSFYFVWDKWSINDERVVNQNIAITDTNSDDDKQITYSSLIPQVTGPKQQPETAVVEETPDPASAEESTDSSVVDDNQVELNQPVNEDDAESLNLSAAVELNAQQGDAVTSAYAITIDIKEQAWVSIKNEDGSNIVHDLLNPGVKQYQADGPMTFRIGNAPQLEIMINDERIELAPFTRNDVADFSWPQDPNS